MDWNKPRKDLGISHHIFVTSKRMRNFHWREIISFVPSPLILYPMGTGGSIPGGEVEGA
jgi:hypothetical protein